MLRRPVPAASPSVPRRRNRAFFYPPQRQPCADNSNPSVPSRQRSHTAPPSRPPARPRLRPSPRYLLSASPDPPPASAGRLRGGGSPWRAAGLRRSRASGRRGFRCRLRRWRRAAATRGRRTWRRTPRSSSSPKVRAAGRPPERGRRGGRGRRAGTDGGWRRPLGSARSLRAALGERASPRRRPRRAAPWTGALLSLRTAPPVTDTRVTEPQGVKYQGYIRVIFNRVLNIRVNDHICI